MTSELKPNFAIRLSGLTCAIAIAAMSTTRSSQVAPRTNAASGEITGGESRRFAVEAEGGDLVGGAALLNGLTGNVRFTDAAGARVAGSRISLFPLGDGRERRVGFIAPEKGTYYAVLTASGNAHGRFTLQMDRMSVAQRMRDVQQPAPKVVYESARLQQLARDVAKGDHDAVERFWREVSGHAPLVEPAGPRPADQPLFLRNETAAQDILVTFLWRQTYELRNVLVSWSDRADDYFMSHLGGTDVWYKTIRLKRGSRFTYSLSPNERPDDWLFTARLDPLNPRVFPDDPNILTDRNSVLDAPGAPDESWVQSSPAARGSVVEKQFKSAVMANERVI